MKISRRKFLNKQPLPEQVFVGLRCSGGPNRSCQRHCTGGRHRYKPRAPTIFSTCQNPNVRITALCDVDLNILSREAQNLKTTGNVFTCTDGESA
jgi:hypothetical protein